MYTVTLETAKDFKWTTERRASAATDVELIHILSFLPLLAAADLERGECLLEPQRGKLRLHRWAVYLSRSRQYQYNRGWLKLESGSLQQSTCEELQKL